MRSRRSASRILDQVFDLRGATGLGGLNALAGFLKRLGIDGKLADRFRHAKARWSRWRFDRILRVLLDAHFAGVERLYHFEELETEPLLCAQQGVDRLPDLKTLYRECGPLTRSRRYVGSLPRSFWRRIPWEGEGEIQVTSSLCRRGGLLLQPLRHQSDWAPEEVARFCDKRADIERTICEAKNDLSIDHVPTSSFAANAADLALKILARNLLVLYRDRGLRLPVRYRVMTLRRRYVCIAGRVVPTRWTPLAAACGVGRAASRDDAGGSAPPREACRTYLSTDAPY